MSDSFLGLPLWAWGGAACLGVAALFAFVVPHKPSTQAAGPRRFLLRWGHALVWVLLAAMCFVWALGLGLLGNVFGLAAGLAYAVFLFTLLSSR
jgi:H+/gluconate symporter-like permease